MKRMVCGFLFHRTSVLLVRKTHPEWQAGLLNGIGGGIEQVNGRTEAPVEAMVREFREEAGLEVGSDSREPAPWWHCFAVERHPSYEVHFFKAEVLASSLRPEVRTVNDVGEQLMWMPAHWTAVPPPSDIKMVGNLRWLIPMALDWRQMSAQVFVGGSIQERPSW